MAAATAGALAALPAAPGVDRFRDARGRVLYIGRATSLRHRVTSYWPDLRDRRHLNGRHSPGLEKLRPAEC